jgi:hypothetical protein
LQNYPNGRLPAAPCQSDTRSSLRTANGFWTHTLAAFLDKPGAAGHGHASRKLANPGRLNAYAAVAQW